MSQKFIRFSHNDINRYGEIIDNQVIAYSDAPWLGGVITDQKLDLSEVKILAPVEPSKIICIGLNYHAHVKASYSADEAPENPLIFLKPPSSLIGHEDNIVHPPQSERVDFEAELALVIGKTGRHIPIEKANDYIFGFTCVNDVTARDLQKADRQWSRAKGFDTFCPTGPHIITDLDYEDILIEGIVNDEVIQFGRTSQMIFKIPFLLHYISSAMTLNPGDLISTGTPAKIAPMEQGDIIEVRIENVGSLKNRMA
jgi:2-keto-4-pentenoate hydratase/2-oxohepta-3-ene-1,7-dioic acid hydratase in catechol pathway